MKVTFRRELHLNGFAVWVYEERRGQTHFAKPAALEFDDKGTSGASLLPEPTFVLTPDQLLTLKQSIQDELVRHGLTTAPDAAVAELKATKYHLEDMRTLTLKPKPHD